MFWSYFPARSVGAGSHLGGNRVSHSERGETASDGLVDLYFATGRIYFRNAGPNANLTIADYVNWEVEFSVAGFSIHWRSTAADRSLT